jgi:transcriptional regulator with XRE-family HTH domain
MATTTTTTTPAGTRPKSPLLELRLRQKLNQERLAVLAGISRGWVGFLERNPEAMTPSAAAKLAAVLGCDPEDLFLEGRDR